jgi:hypothetical protein
MIAFQIVGILTTLYCWFLCYKWFMERAAPVCKDKADWFILFVVAVLWIGAPAFILGAVTQHNTQQTEQEQQKAP